jgi:hypothetical protein
MSLEEGILQADVSLLQHMGHCRRGWRPWITGHTWAGKGKGELTATNEDLVGAVLVAQLGSIALARLELDGDLLLVEQVGAFKNDAKAALANLLPDAVVDAHDVGRGAAAGHSARREACLGRRRVWWSRSWSWESRRAMLC